MQYLANRTHFILEQDVKKVNSLGKPQRTLSYSDLKFASNN